MPNLLLGALKPTPTGATLLAGAAVILRNYLSRASYIRLFLLWLLFLNRGAFPLRWHFKLFWIALRARLRWEAARMGWYTPTTEQRRIGLTKKDGGDLALGGIGKNAFDIVSTRHTRVSFAESDYNLHLSNSNYAQAGDFARMQYASDYLGAAYSQDRIMTLLGATSFVYLREIPMFANYTTETRMVAYDDKWGYVLTRYIIPYDKRSKRPASRSLSTGKDCTICAFLLSRICFKRGRVNVTPEKICSAAGMVGPDDVKGEALRNWTRAVELRRTKALKEWLLKEDDAGEYIRGGEELNKKGLEIISRLHDSDRKVWMELDELRQ